MRLAAGFLFVSFGIFLTGRASGTERDVPDLTTIAHWQAPPYWLPWAEEREVHAGGRQALAASPTALPFIALFPCRLVDTRAPAFPAPLGGGFLPPATVRSYTLAGVCNVPANAQAISLNVTVVNPTGPGFITLWPEGGAFPPVSTLNYLGHDVIVNAAVVPLSAAGGISIALGVSGGDVILDTNGYYATVPSVTSLNALSGDLTLAAGSNVTITPSGQTLTIAATAGGAGTVSSVGTGAGLTGGPITTTGTLSVASLGITTGMMANGAVTSAKLAPGAVGLAQIDPTQVQGRVASGCPDGTMIQGVHQDGTVDCSAFAPKFGFSVATLDGAALFGGGTSITVGPDGDAVISYYDGTNLRLKLAHCNPNCTNSSNNAVIDSAGDVGFSNSITIGADGNSALISYYDATNLDLKVAYCTVSSCTITTLDSPGDVGFRSSIAIGQDGLGLIAYSDATNGNLKVAHCSNAACTAATITTVDASGTVGFHNSIAIGVDGLGLISYYNATSHFLKVAHCSNVLCTAATTNTLDSAADVGKYNSVTVGWDGLGVISYFDVTNGHLKVARCANILCTAAATNTLDASPNVGNFGTSITIGSDFLPVISYYDGTTPGLKVAHCFDMACTSASFAILDGGGAAGVGKWSSITIASDGFPLISYYGAAPNAVLKAAHCSNAACTPFVRRR